GNAAHNLMIENLADGNAGVDANRLDSKHFERPIPAKTNIAEASRDVNKETEAADAGPALDHWNEVMRLGSLAAAAEIKLLRRENEAFFGYAQPPGAVRRRHVEHNLFVGQQLVMQRQVVAIRVEPRIIIRVDDDVVAQIPTDFVAGKDHGSIQGSGF